MSSYKQLFLKLKYKNSHHYLYYEDGGDVKFDVEKRCAMVCTKSDEFAMDAIVSC